MDEPVATASNLGAPLAPMAQHVADTMRRVHAELRDGATPSYESLLVFGTPGSVGPGSAPVAR